MPKHKHQETAADPLAGVEINHPFPRLRLTDAQWSKTAALSSIPRSAGEARRSIEIALGMFRQFQATDLDHRPAAEIQKELRDLAKDTRNLYKRVSDLASNRDAYTALVNALIPPNSLDGLSDISAHQEASSRAEPCELEDAQRVSELCDVLLNAPKWFLIAAYRLKDEKRGPKARNVRWLVGNLDGIREQFTGKKITRSYKDAASLEYITYVCRIADPALGKGSIVNAMRDRIEQHNYRGARRQRKHRG